MNKKKRRAHQQSNSSTTTQVINKAIHYKGERRPITLKLQEREEHLRAARNYGEEAEEKDRDEGEGREPREEA